MGDFLRSPRIEQTTRLVLIYQQCFRLFIVEGFAGMGVPHTAAPKNDIVRTWFFVVRRDIGNNIFSTLRKVNAPAASQLRI